MPWSLITIREERFSRRVCVVISLSYQTEAFVYSRHALEDLMEDDDDEECCPAVTRPSTECHTNHDADDDEIKHNRTTDDSRVEDDSRFEQENLPVLLGHECSVDIVSVSVVVMGDGSESGVLLLVDARAIAPSGVMVTWEHVPVSDSRADQVEEESDKGGREGNSCCGRLEGEFSDALVLEHDEAVEEKVLHRGQKEPSLA